MAITYKGGNRLVGLSSDAKPVDLDSGSTFIETDTGKESTLQYGSWIEINRPSVTSVAELLDDYSQIRPKRFWYWFSGSDLTSDYLWTLTNKTSANASEQRMSDSLDGGYIFEAVNGHQSTLTFNNFRQYDHNGSGFIGVCKRKNDSGNFGCGLKGDKSTADGHSGLRNGARLIFKTGTSDIQAQSADTDGVTNTDTSVASSDAWRLFSATLASSSIKYFVDGVLEVTHTSSDQIPDAKLQPYVYAEGQGANSGGQIRYYEAYNT
tara:strand:- start:669 stop:1463 length:795 start_codon:yes stop_codon:yes gene_type:complete